MRSRSCSCDHLPSKSVHGKGKGGSCALAGDSGNFGENLFFGKHSEHWPSQFIVKISFWVFVFFVVFSAKEEEKQKLLKWSSDLKQEREQLEQKVKQLSSSISVSEPPAFGEKADRASVHIASSCGSQGQLTQLTWADGKLASG